MAATSRNPILDDTPLSVFEPIIARLKRTKAGRIIPLHQGKTAFTSPVELRDWREDEFDYPPHHDGPTCGTETLITAIREKIETQLGESIDPARLQVTCGITHALSIIFHCILRPGDEVLILSPQWLFAPGLVRAAGGGPVEVPFFPPSSSPCLRGVTDRILPFLTSQTRAIYFNTPNNPTGCCLSRQEMEELVSVAHDRGLWIISDNAYEDYDYSADGFIDPSTMEGGKNRTFSTYSFSKAFGLTGYRIGYLLSPPEMAESVRKFGLYSIYSVPTCCQFVARSALRSGPALLEGHRRFVKNAMDITIHRLRVPFARPEGGFYAFLDLSGWTTGVDDFIGQCISEGVSLAPGHAFGANYTQYARLCFAVVGHEDLGEGIRLINQIYESKSAGLHYREASVTSPPQPER
jgi:aspartate aminotransferase